MVHTSACEVLGDAERAAVPATPGPSRTNSARESLRRQILGTLGLTEPLGEALAGW